MTPPKPRPPCPICNKPNLKQFRPFCSARCADIDLGKWFSGAYAVPGEPVNPNAVTPEDDSQTD